MTDLRMNPSQDWFTEVPRSIAKLTVIGLGLMIGGLGGFGIWATTAPLAAAVIAQGSFVATGRNKIVQHLEGGIIHSIDVSEGDVVKEGDVLVELDQTAARADQRELWLRQLRLEAIEARLLSEANLSRTMNLPDHLVAEMTVPEIADIVTKQRMAFDVSRSVIESNLSVIETALTSLEIRIEGYEAQLASHRARLADMRAEFADRKTLADKGLLATPELGVMRRAILDAEGQIARLEAQIGETHMEMGRVEREREKYLSDRRQSVYEDLQEIQAQLDSIREQTRKADAVLVRSQITAPVAGTVVRLHYHSPGGVIETGKPIAELLPADAPLIVEITVLRTDIDTVRVGQSATVRLSAMNQRTTPVLNGHVSYVSADSLSESTDGLTRQVYKANVEISRAELERLTDAQVVPGMPAEVMVQTETRTFFEYLTKPVRDSMSRAFREH
ncbi:HlyD family type I secretion periplasmic adaptor subunit [Maribius pontilimi]|uniref:Membrane fusion protein (MFP) family protein n=1 Tax=Palleronia pontilimi TaxID=1964209 RepID=A0A934IF68_9RHOB|nr:HlyD family type I secretion periplasmic adaptor subunit [Palleronia pontilimi]MBJ3762340.1 HlyD family type I secretion periplasmic adaptor subunit [Palleronia pontilimi]